MSFNFNTFHSDRWTATFSNIPGLNNLKEMQYFDNFVKSVVIPDYNAVEIFSDWNGFRVRHPTPKRNEDLSQIQFEFKLAENLRNYFAFFNWMRNIKYGNMTTDDELFRKFTIKTIGLNILDNQKREVSRLIFTQCFLLTLSSLSLSTGESEEISFTANFSYEEVNYEDREGICTQS